MRVLRPQARSIALRDLVLDERGALHERIYRALRDAILSGRAVAGTRLPTTRALAAELGLSRNTVVAAFDALRAEGYVAARVGAGTFVAPQVSTRGELGARRAGAPSAPARTPGGSARRDASRAPATTPPLIPTPSSTRTATPTRVDDAGLGGRARLSRYGRALARQAPRRLYDAAEASAPLPYDFRPCVPDLEGLSYDGWRRSLARAAWSVPASTFDYGDPSGSLELRREIAAYLGRARGVECSAESIVIVGGVAQALDLAARLLVDPGDPVLVEDPHYLGARRVFEAAGARLVGAPVDGEGLALACVPRARLARCRLAYVTPSHQFPTGVVLSLARRQSLLAWADRAGAFVIEDDYDSEFRYAGRAIPALKSLDAGDRVLYVGTFSKTLMPSLRIAYVVLPAALRESFRTAKWLADWSAPGFEQAVLARQLASGDFERHLRRARTAYAARRAALLEAIDRALGPHAAIGHDSRAGLHLLLELPNLSGERPFDWVAAGRARGLGLYPVAPCHLARPPETLDFVMGFARLEPDAIREGIDRFAGLLAVGPGPGGRPSDRISGKLRASGRAAGRRRAR